MIKYYTSPFSGTIPIIASHLIMLPDIEDKDGILRSQWNSWSVANRANLASDNLAIVYVNANESVHVDLAKDRRYGDAGDPYATDDNGNDLPAKITHDNLMSAHQSNERRYKFNLEKKLDRCEKLIAKNERIAARKDEYRANREAKRVALVDLKTALIEIRDETFIDDIDLVVAEFERIFANTKRFEAEINDKLYIFTQAEIITGIRKPFPIRINVLLRATNGVNTRISNHVREKQRLIAEIAELDEITSGTPDEGDNLEQVKAKLETQIGAI